MAHADRGAVLVTGSPTGIGRACAPHLDGLAFRVFAGVRREADGASLAADASDRLEPVIVDVTDEATIAAASARIEEATQGRLAGLVNNAGVIVAGPIEGVPLDEWRRQFEVNVVGQVAVTRALLPMLRAAKGRVVFMSSIGGRNALPMIAPTTRPSTRSRQSETRCARRCGHSASRSRSPRRSGPRARLAPPMPGQRWAMRSTVFYGARLDRVPALAAETGAKGIPPERVAEAVGHALTATRPKTRYLVGLDAKIQARMGAALPDRVFDSLVARMLRD